MHLRPDEHRRIGRCELRVDMEEGQRGEIDVLCGQAHQGSILLGEQVLVGCGHQRALGATRRSRDEMDGGDIARPDGRRRRHCRPRKLLEGAVSAIV